MPELQSAAQAAEGVLEESLHIMGVQSAGLCLFHAQLHLVDVLDPHDLSVKSEALDQLDGALTESGVNDLVELGPHLGLITVTDRLDQQLTQRFPLI
ncbi:hypothetical protein ACFVRD_09830 [Streptomyces sp. NPDC057908]|uniref:hypothetical protein n=1 Tax=Streptomyces sp. NPDC057908 TaxID=3346276 RepID=UPI0036E5C414